MQNCRRRVHRRRAVTGSANMVARRIGLVRLRLRCGVDGWDRGTAVPRMLVWAEWEDGQEPFDSRKKPGSYSPATRLPGSSRKAGEMTIMLPTEKDPAERPGEPPEHLQRAAAQRPLQRGDNPAVDALADALVLAGTKAVDWVFEAGGPKAWAWGKQTVADWKASALSMNVGRVGRHAGRRSWLVPGMP